MPDVSRKSAALPLCPSRFAGPARPRPGLWVSSSLNWRWGREAFCGRLAEQAPGRAWPQPVPSVWLAWRWGLSICSLPWDLLSGSSPPLALWGELLFLWVRRGLGAHLGFTGLLDPLCPARRWGGALWSGRFSPVKTEVKLVSLGAFPQCPRQKGLHKTSCISGSDLPSAATA